MFSVRWKRSARDRLAEIWMRANDRSAIASAANKIDTLLRTSPETRGESRDGGRRILIESPLGVVFQVKPQDHIVHVLSVWRFD